MNNTKTASNKTIIICMIILSAFLSYYPLHENGFLNNYDDFEYVTGNPNVNTGLSLTNIKWAFTSFHSANWHPLTWMSHMLDAELFGLNPGGHHLTSLVIHIINALLLFMFLNVYTKSLWKSAFAAMLFALHPLNVESVAWVSERKNLLCTLFFFITLITYKKYVEKPAFTKYIFVILSFALGLMSKPMVVTLPFILLLLDYWPLNRVNDHRFFINRNNRKLIIEKTPLFLLTLISCVITVNAQKQWNAVASFDNVSTLARYSNVVINYSGYLFKTIWPANLSIYYTFPDTIPFIKAAASLIFLSAASVLIIIKRGALPWLITGWLWYLGTLVPVIGIVQVGNQAAADRYAYIPLIGIFIILSWTTGRITEKSGSLIRYLTLLICAAMVLFFSFRTHQYSKEWKNTGTVFEYALNTTKDNYFAYKMCGAYALGKKDYRKAIEYHKKSIEIKSEIKHPLGNIAIAYKELGIYDSSKIYFKKAISNNTDSWQAWNNFGMLYLDQNNIDSAIIFLKKALSKNPYSWEVCNNLGIAYAVSGNDSAAISNYDLAVKLNEKDIKPLLNRGNLYFKKRKYNKAIKDYNKALRLEPQNSTVLYRTGLAYEAINEKDSAALCFSKFLNEDLEYEKARSRLDSLIKEGQTGKKITNYYTPGRM